MKYVFISYVGKTERTLFQRTKEHGEGRIDSAIHKHMGKCDNYQFINNLQTLGTNITTDDIAYNVNNVRNNIRVIDRDNNWNTLLFKEALLIKQLKPKLNHGIKASRELQLFS